MTQRIQDLINYYACISCDGGTHHDEPDNADV